MQNGSGKDDSSILLFLIKRTEKKERKRKKPYGLFHVQKLWYNGQAIYDFWISSVMKAAFDAAVYMEGGP